ncbi:MAG: hypothetical protein A3F17_00810 [Gammaproteobacteria bacterium RIFCSPHIGHO2_12_FULL_41_15]|nr:MAG: hypothetical protein A3F17_00810 [Gammaproteobacteria bacterium RIFCSPHIGHO2_12_FULL_41_15]
MKKIFTCLGISILIILCQLTFAQPEPLPADEAYQPTALIKDKQTIIVQWQIAKGYYLYRDRLHVSPANPSTTRLGQPLRPTGITRHNNLIGNYQAYKNEVQVGIPIIYNKGDQISFKVNYQGCSENEFCYPPTEKVFTLNLNGPYMQPMQPVAIDIATAMTSAATAPQDKVTQLLSKQNIFSMIFTFLGIGLLIAFTPCVLPMVPIVSSIVIGQNGQKKIFKGFLLSLAYVQGMAITYAILGVIFAMIGKNIQAALQTPLVIGLFSLLFVAMALSLFGLFELKIPNFFHHHAHKLSNKQKSGSFVGAFLMGVLSTLILSPCVTAPLVGTLGFISKTGNVWFGGIALYSMGIGMGLPLLIIGGLEGRFIPKTGTWMNTIKHILGVMMLGVAIWMLARILPGPATLALWGILAIGSAIFMGTLSSHPKKNGLIYTKLTLGWTLLIYGTALLLSAASGGSDPFKPLAFLQGHHSDAEHTLFKRINTITELNHYLADAKVQNKPILLDFYADWCVSCKEMEKFTFSDSEIKKLFKQFILLQVDVTHDNLSNQKILKQYDVIAPPTILFFDTKGNELKSYRIIGEMGAKPFTTHLQQVLAHKKL